MTKSRRTLSVVSILLVVALLAAACGGSGDSGSTAAEPTPEPLPPDVLARALVNYQGPIGALQAPGDTLTVPLTVTGVTQAVAITGGNPPCPGWVNTFPDYVFETATGLASLDISFAGTTMGTLMVVSPQGAQIFCTDTITLQPSLRIEQPEQGRYMVLVGRGNLSGANTGKLTVTGQ